MALNAYLTIPGIQGPVTLNNRVGTILVFGVAHSIATPIDINGVMAGVYTSRPFAITKELDVTSPTLYTALTNYQNLSPDPNNPLTIDFWTPILNPIPGNDGEAIFYTISLTNATIVSINFSMNNNLQPLNVNMPPLEVVTFTYSSIQWSLASGTSATANYPGLVSP